MLSLLMNPLTGKELDWAEPSKHPSMPMLGRSVINKCFTSYGDEDMVKECIDKYHENRALMDPTLGGTKTLSNMTAMYHQPAQNW